MRRRVVLYVVVACAFALPFVIANVTAAHTSTRYACTRSGSACIPRRCLTAEDSAAHLYLYTYADGRAVYHCHHRGY